MSKLKKQPQAPGRQVGGMFISPNWIEDPSLAGPYLKQTAQMGYTTSIMLVRHQRRNILDAKVHDAIKEIVRVGHKHGLKMVLDTDHAHWWADFVETHPETALWAIVPATGFVQDGRFEVTIKFPRVVGMIVFEELSAVFCPDKIGGYRRIDVRNIKPDVTYFYVPQAGLTLTGRLPNGISGNMVFYIAIKTFGLVDVAHPHYLKG